MGQTQPKRLLIIEDSPAVSSRLLTLLADVAHLQIIGVESNGESGFSRIIKELPDIILLDLHLPVLSGLQILRSLQSEKLKPVIVVLTSESGDVMREKCLVLGVIHFYDKLTQFEEAIGVIKNLCSTD